MPLSLHPLLRQPLTADDLYLCPEDDIEEAPVEHHDPEQRAAKRRRVEAIAARYLRGQPPVILTAGLRGPFNNGWKNPWAKPRKEKQETAQTSHAKLKRRSRVYSTDSPETARAARDINLSAREYDDSLGDIEVPPPTAPLPDEDSACAATGSETWTGHQSRSTSPVWLRRPDSPRVRMPSATNEQSDSSPTRSRSRKVHSQTKSVVDLHISFPKGPVHPQRTLTEGTLPEGTSLDGTLPEGTLPEDWKSSASASMDISSAHGDNSTRSGMDHPVQSICTPYSTEQAQRSQRTVPIVTSSMGSQTPVSRDDVQRSAERLIDSMAASSKMSQRSSRKASRKTPRLTKQSDAVSPVLTSLASTHQKTGQANQARNKPSKPKPRAVNFDSSPEKASPVTKQVNRKPDPIEKLVDENQDQQSRVVPQSARTATDLPAHEGELQKSYVSRESDWCTQAALVRAQLEFQQSTFPTLSPATLRAESQVSLDTPRVILDGPSPAATPLTTSAVPRNEALPSDGVFRGPTISTQDLFGAASPFTFSTVKKKGEGSQGSHLKLGMGAGDVGASFKLGDAINNSPTPTGRIPLKDKNTTTSFWSFVSEKASQGSQGSQGCPGERSRCSARESEFPPLRLDASVDDFGRHFTGSFVRGLEEG